MGRRVVTWVIAGPLSHFAKAGWLGVLKMLALEHRIMIPDVVDAELGRGAAQQPGLSSSPV